MADTAKGRRHKVGPSEVDFDRGSDLDQRNRGLLDSVLEVAARRRHILSKMRDAIQVGDKDSVFSLAKQLTGLDYEKSYKPN